MPTLYTDSINRQVNTNNCGDQLEKGAEKKGKREKKRENRKK